MNILFSPSSQRMVIEENNQSKTIQPNEDFSVGKIIFSAPTSKDVLAKSFSNRDIDDWEERQVESLEEVGSLLDGT